MKKDIFININMNIHQEQDIRKCRHNNTAHNLVLGEQTYRLQQMCISVNKDFRAFFDIRFDWI